MVKISNKLTQLSEIIERKQFSDEEYEQIEMIGRTLHWLMDRGFWDRVTVEVDRLEKYIS